MELKRQIGSLPNKPGVYFFKDIKNKVLYIGKAQNLKERVGSYFRAENELAPAKQKMIEKASNISWQETSSEIEALILESSLIKKYKPPYNVSLKDDKNYFFVTFTEEKFPKIFVTHQLAKTENQKLKTKNYYIGPFTDGAAIKTTLKILRKTFPYCTCRSPHKRPCVRSEIKKCLGVCCLNQKNRGSFFPDFKDRALQYKRNIAALKTILLGKSQKILKDLKRSVEKESRKQEFEKAEEIYGKLKSLKKVFEHHAFIRRGENHFNKAVYYLKNILRIPKIEKIESYDISNIRGKDAAGSMVAFENGKLNKDKYRRFLIRGKKTPDDIAMLKEILERRLKHQELALPELFLIDGGIAQFNVAKKTIADSSISPKPEVAAVAKKDEILFTEKGVFYLKKMPPPLLHFIQYLRDEAHRFAIQYHKLRRRKSLFVKQVS